MITLSILCAVVLGIAAWLLYKAREQRQIATALDDLALGIVGAAAGVFIALLADREIGKISDREAYSATLEVIQNEMKFLGARIEGNIELVETAGSAEEASWTLATFDIYDNTGIAGVLQSPEAYHQSTPEFVATGKSVYGTFEAALRAAHLVQSPNETSAYYGIALASLRNLMEIVSIEQMALTGAFSRDSAHKAFASVVHAQHRDLVAWDSARAADILGRLERLWEATDSAHEVP